MTILVLGAGVSGVAALRNARGLGHAVRCFDGRPDALLPSDLADVVLSVGDWRDAYLDGVEMVVASPGFPPSAPSIVAIRAAGVPIIAEAQFGLEQSDAALVAVTGTNGKSTVTQVTADMLRASGIAAVAAGNIGQPLSEVVGRSDHVDVIVAELSSFQLDLMHVHPVAASILNIAPDHLDWHGSHEAYVAAKASIVDEMTGDDVFVSNVDDGAVVDIAARVRCRVVPTSGFGVPEGGNGVDGDMLVIDDRRYRAPIDDPSYRFDLVVAGSLAGAAGASSEGIGTVIDGFRPGEHRRELVATIDGVRFINDSKATNPHATVAAAEAYDRVRLLAGGKNKNLDLSSIGAIENLVALYAFGEAAREIADGAFGSVSVFASMEDAVRAAALQAEDGDVVLLSPGCTSFDEFTSYADRGERFTELVRSIGGGDRR